MGSSCTDYGQREICVRAISDAVQSLTLAREPFADSLKRRCSGRGRATPSLPRAGALAQKLGPEYIALIIGLEQVDPSSREAQEIGSVLNALDKECIKK